MSGNTRARSRCYIVESRVRMLCGFVSMCSQRLGSRTRAAFLYNACNGVFVKRFLGQRQSEGRRPCKCNVDTDSMHKRNAIWYLFAVPKTPESMKARLAQTALLCAPVLTPILFMPHLSLVLRHAARRRSMAIPAMHHDRGLSAGALHLLLHVGAVLDVLPEVANVAADFLVRLEREGDDGDEAEGEPFPGMC